jgi:beta-galactosidase
MDDLGHFAGFVSAEASVDPAGGVLEFTEVRDRAQVFVDGRLAGVVNRDHFERRVVIPPSDHGHLRVLVEDLGRVNYGEWLGEPKGLIGDVRFDGRPIEGWHTRPLDLERVPALAAEVTARGTGGALAGPVVARATFDLDDAGMDRFLGTRDLGKGVAWVNGLCLGRYWSRGPQHRLYVPGPVLRSRDNELVVLELDSLPAEVRFHGEPDLGHREV